MAGIDHGIETLGLDPVSERRIIVPAANADGPAETFRSHACPGHRYGNGKSGFTPKSEGDVTRLISSCNQEQPHGILSSAIFLTPFTGEKICCKIFTNASAKRIKKFLRNGPQSGILSLPEMLDTRFSWLNMTAIESREETFSFLRRAMPFWAHNCR
jgi:hypothetical protein